MITYEFDSITVYEFDFLYHSVGWKSHDPEVISEALKHNIFSVSVYENDHIIGCGRIIGDKTMFLYLQDIIVIPEYQSKGIGTGIMHRLLDKVNELKAVSPAIRVYLGASLNKEPFYEKFGFVTRENSGLGSGMILNRLKAED